MRKEIVGIKAKKVQLSSPGKGYDGQYRDLKSGVKLGYQRHAAKRATDSARTKTNVNSKGKEGTVLRGMRLGEKT